MNQTIADASGPIVIIGGGPVGLTFALELAHHGAAPTLIEPRMVVEHSRPRAKTTSARSLELLRRRGAADEIRQWAAAPGNRLPHIRNPTGDDLVLVRPDQHIAWVGRPSVDPDHALELAIRGFPATT